MRRRYWTIALVACTVVSVAAGAEAQQAALDSARSTLSGVFTEDQARFGREVYAGRCRSCHTQAAHVGTFKAAFAGHALADAYEYLTENMPKDAPGTLSESETASVLAYFLELLGEPAGQQALGADPDSLRAIRIDTLTTQPTHGIEEKKS